MQFWRHHRDALETDLHAVYGLEVDLSDPLHDKALQRRSWRWFLVRVHGLLADPRTRTYAALVPAEPTTTGGPP